MIGRRAPVQRSPLQRSTTPIPRRRSKPRRGPADVSADEWRNPGYRQFLREEGKCCVCQAMNRAFKYGDEAARQALRAMASGYNSIFEPCDPAHTRNNGAGSKGPDSSCAPLCRVHHDQYDGHAKLPDGSVGRVAFERFYVIDMHQEAGVWWAAWLIYKETLA